MTQAAQIRELGNRIALAGIAMEQPGADVKAEAASIDRMLVRLKHLTTEVQNHVTVCHERPALICQQTCEPIT